MQNGRRALLDDVRSRGLRLRGDASDYDALIDLVGERRVVLIGEASHGTHEFYRERAEITKRLILERGFHAVAIEGDWPDAHRVHQYAAGRSGDDDAEEALRGFQRFPTWMWRNSVVLDFVGWLRDHNEGRGRPVGFYGFDLYSLYSSMDVVVRHLETSDPHAAARARARYSCFDHYNKSTEAYAYGAGLGLSSTCERQVLAQLVELRRRAAERLPRDDAYSDEAFFLEQNAVVVKNAERYYRNMLFGRVNTWNMRDQHMFETIEAILGHLDKGLRGLPSKVVVWAHNSHLGDARATDMGATGELNVGQLARHKLGRDAVLNVGFTTYDGTVTAASDWDQPAERKIVRPALPESYESLFHETGIPRFMLMMNEREADPLAPPRLERAIGVIYRPSTERASHYFNASLPAQFDVVIHLDKTRAVEPLERTSGWMSGEAPETYPFAV